MKSESSFSHAALTPDEQRTHLMLFFFGPGSDAIKLSVSRAYRDFSRTLHGLKGHENAANPGREYLQGRLHDLPQKNRVIDQRTFDSWHKVTCLGIIKCFNTAGFFDMHIGQAQKWLNMAFKYIFFFSPSQN